jgi:pimeloyl-ACP methyl ester carboxylesterase
MPTIRAANAETDVIFSNKHADSATAFAAAVSICLALGVHSVATATSGDEIYARPGHLVTAQGTRLNFYCTGRGSPTVVFDSGWGDWAPVWTIVQPQVAKWTRACSYDRAGAGFSDPGLMPRTSVRIADELRRALHNALIQGPYILVGHAFGGDNVRTFAARYPAEVAGLVLVEADIAGALEEQRGRARLIAGLRECRDAIAAGRPLPPLSAPPGRPSRSCAQQFFRGLPEAMWSSELNAKLLELAQTKVAMYDTYISEMEQMSQDETYLQQHSGSLGSRPIRVLSTGNHGVHSLDPSRPPDPEHQKYEEQVAREQAKWLELSSNARQLFTDKSSEYIPFDQPSFVVDAIREVYSQSK